MFLNTFIGKLLATFFMSMIPIIELRGAIPFGVALGLPVPVAFITAIIGNLLPVPFIILFIRKIFDWLRGKSDRLNNLVNKFEAHTLKKADKVRKGAFWGLLLFVAIPIPGTGAWTGAIIAALLEVRYKIALPAITLGVISAAIIMSLLSYCGILMFF